MPVFLSTNCTVFPPLWLASPEGVLAVGGDLSRERLLMAYANGIFPWYDSDSPILWWAPPERCMLRPEELHIPQSLRRAINARRFCITLDTNFEQVIRSCAYALRSGCSGSWIVPEMIVAYCDLHEAGYAHSVEAWLDGELVGGLYGVSLGGVFFGESMFFRVPDASKTAFVWLTRLLREWKFTLIDCQQVTDNLARFGAYAVPRADFMGCLAAALPLRAVYCKWSMPEGFFPL